MRINKKEQFPFEIERLSDEENKEVTRCYNGGVVWKFIRIGPQKYFFPNIYEKFAERIYNLELRKDDIFVASFPKCGTTWLQELVWLINNNLDYDRAKTVILNKRFPFLEMEGLKGAINTETNEIMINYTEQDKKALIPMKFDDILTMPTTSPRFIKTHLPLSLLPPTLLDNNKMVYITREPRDVVVSFYYHNKLMKNMNDEPDLKTFWKFFKNSQVIWSPFFQSVQEAWEKRNHPNLLFLFYEDLLKDLRGNVQRVAEFFGKSLTNEQLNELSEHLTFDNFKKNKAVNLEEMSEKGIFTKDGAFIRQGKSGTWRDHFDAEMTLEADRWISENLQNTDLRFPSMNN
ncbi:sulfotransferase 1E1-like isoform X1 [Leptidea sinapis]|uniref:sulfotransferase 1E1-like isoform X1 n=2 Tax=Leptidea sinapis TaxID=189913 RepID=UPI002140D0D0|nr:sulfotransferase 1E1-like isoform X1 [Leptidea sinapis]